MNDELNLLVKDITQKNYSLVPMYGFNSIYKEKDRINSLEGDVVECGIWKGGMCIFLSKLFSNKKIWCVDSFTGFQELKDSKYPNALLQKYNLNEPHVLGTCIREGRTGFSLEEVKEIFNEYGELNNPNVNFLKGYVNDTLNPDVCPIQKISLLRIDVDSYSATTEVLEYLYPKVVKGGMIVFDDGNIDSARFAILDFFNKKESEMLSYNPGTGNISIGLGECNFIFKD